MIEKKLITKETTISFGGGEPTILTEFETVPETMMFLIGSTATAFLTAFGEGAMLAASVYLASRGVKRRRR